MATTKTVQTALHAWQDVNSGSQVFSTAFNCATTLSASFAIRIGRRTGTAFTAGSPNIRIEASAQDSGDRRWTPIFPYQPLVGASIANTTLNGAVSANAATFVVASNSNIAAGDILFLGDTSTANYELIRVKSVSSTTITPEENVINAHANAALVTDQAEMTFPAVDLSDYRGVRAVIDNAGSGQAISVEVQMTTLDTV